MFRPGWVPYLIYFRRLLISKDRDFYKKNIFYVEFRRNRYSSSYVPSHILIQSLSFSDAIFCSLTKQIIFSVVLKNIFFKTNLSTQSSNNQLLESLPTWPQTGVSSSSYQNGIPFFFHQFLSLSSIIYVCVLLFLFSSDLTVRFCSDLQSQGDEMEDGDCKI